MTSSSFMLQSALQDELKITNFQNKQISEFLLSFLMQNFHIFGIPSDELRGSSAYKRRGRK